jgi:hypothetical protein
MTYQPAVTALDTLQRLLDLARMQGKASDALPFALAWLVVGKLAAQGRISVVSHVTQRDAEQVVTRIQRLDAPPELREALSRAFADKGFGLQHEANYLVTQLLDSPQKTQWGLQDAAWAPTGRARLNMDGGFAYDPALCDLAVESLHVQSGEVVWVPFDPSGQFTVRLVRAGARVWRAGPGYGAPDLTAMLLALEDDPAVFERVTFATTTPDVEGRNAVVKCLVAPPMGMKVPRTTEWRKWEQVSRAERRLWVTPDETDRSDAWAVAAMWPAVEKRGVFLASPSLLFGHGQEHRLRKALMLDQRGNMVAASVSLPTGVLNMSSVAPSMLILDAEHRADRVRVVDLGGSDSSSGSRKRLGRDLDSRAAAELLAPKGLTPQVAADIELREIEGYDFSLMPQRYLRRVEDLTGNRRPLGELLTATVRSPVPTKDLNAWPVWEIGIPRLDQWRPISSGYDRSMSITPRKADEALLREGDLVLSIKGTVGKVGIVGSIPESYDEAVAHATTALLRDDQHSEDGAPKSPAAVAAASCVALRVNRQLVLPEYLLLYLRSDDFKRQLEALRVGATIAHITPAALLSGVQVLLLPLEQQQRLCERYRELCELEEQVESLQERMQGMRDALFTTTEQLN